MIIGGSQCRSVLNEVSTELARLSKVVGDLSKHHADDAALPDSLAPIASPLPARPPHANHPPGPKMPTTPGTPSLGTFIPATPQSIDCPFPPGSALRPPFLRSTQPKPWSLQESCNDCDVVHVIHPTVVVDTPEHSPGHFWKETDEENNHVVSLNQYNSDTSPLRDLPEPVSEGKMRPMEEKMAALRSRFNEVPKERTSDARNSSTSIRRSSTMFHPKLNMANLCTEVVKEKVRAEALRNGGLGDEYHTAGLCQRIARHHFFELAANSAIIANALWVAYDIDTNESDSISKAKPVYVAADILFYAFFTLELVIRFGAFRSTLIALRNRWFLFDTALVLLYTVDPFLIGLTEMVTGGTKINVPTGVLRLLRLMRLTRLTRLLKSFPELLILIKGMLTALATVGYTLAFLGVVTFVIAVAIRSLVSSESQIKRMYFPSVLESMHQLLLHGAFTDSLTDFILRIQSDSVPILLLSWLYIALSAVLIINMLIGLLCEVISVVATTEKEIMMIERVQENFTSLLNKHDQDNDGFLGWEELVDLLEDSSCQPALRNVGVAAEAFLDVAEDIFFYGPDDDDADEVLISYDDFIHLLLDLRGSQTATVKDVLTIGKRLNLRFCQIKAMIEDLRETTR